METRNAYLDRSFKLEKNGLRNEDLARLRAEVSDFRLEKLNLLSGTAASDFEETVDYRIEIDLVLVGHRGEFSRAGEMAHGYGEGRGVGSCDSTRQETPQWMSLSDGMLRMLK